MPVAAGHRLGMEKRVEDGLSSSFNDGHKKGRHGTVTEYRDSLGISCSPIGHTNPLVGGKSDHIIAASVRRDPACPGQPQHSPLGQPLQITCFERSIGSYDNHTRSIGRVLQVPV